MIPEKSNIREILSQVEPVSIFATIDPEKKAMPEPVFINSSLRDVTSRGQVYTGFPFSLSPTHHSDGLFKVEVIGITRDIIEYIKKHGGFETRLEIFRESNPDDVTAPIAGRLFFDPIDGLLFELGIRP